MGLIHQQQYISATTIGDQITITKINSTKELSIADQLKENEL